MAREAARGVAAEPQAMYGTTMSPPRRPKLWEALVPLLVAALIIFVGVVFFHDQAEIPVLLALACVAPAVMALRLGHTWAEVEQGMLDGMRLSLQAIVILLVVGTTIGAWALSGTVATMVHLGLLILRPGWFLVASCVICSVVSLSMGSSWTTAATVGVALMGIGTAMGIPPPMTAGAVLSGAYFGDKMSPLSDTTNLAPGIAGARLFPHIHGMLYTTLPAWIVALILFAVLGGVLGDTSGFSATSVEELQQALAMHQVLSPWLLLPVALVVLLALLRVPAVPVLCAATAAGGLLAWLVQGAGSGEILSVLFEGYKSSSGLAAMDDILSRGGMSSMLYTVCLILAATAFGGIMEKAGFVGAILEALLRRVRTVGGLVTSTIVACLGSNFILAEQYLAIVLPGRMFRETYPRFGLQPRMLSRTIEDGGTLTGVLCPWNSCGAFMATTLGVATIEYAPYAFLNLLVPVIAIVYAWTGVHVLKQEVPAAAARQDVG